MTATTNAALTTLSFGGRVLVVCDGTMDALGCCRECGQPITSSSGAHLREVAPAIVPANLMVSR